MTAICPSFQKRCLMLYSKKRSDGAILLQTNPARTEKILGIVQNNYCNHFMIFLQDVYVCKTFYYLI